MLPKSAVELDAGWVDFPRPKTAIKRRCPLWPETVAEIRAALDERPVPKHAEHQGLEFVTKYGKCWAKVMIRHAILHRRRYLASR